MNGRLHSLSGGLIAVVLLVAPNTEQADCSNAAGRYAAAAGHVLEALHTYEKCIAAGPGSGDCAAPMQALDDAHDNFADAVADMAGCQ